MAQCDPQISLDEIVEPLKVIGEDNSPSMYIL